MRRLLLLGLLVVSMTAVAAETKVIVFQPDLMKNPQKQGHCWTESIATLRADAWRCMVGNEIFDPCFSTTQKEYVVCGVNPMKKDSGFALKLTQPLMVSKTKITQKTPRPWLVQLEDQSVCAPYTGTRAIIDKKPIEYGCSHASKQKADQYAGIINIDTTGKVWLAHKIIYTATKQGVKIEKEEKVPVKTAWE